MNRSLLTALLLAASAFNAGAQRISLEVPLSPRPILSPGLSVSPLAQTLPLTLSPWTPALAAPSIVAPVKAAASLPSLPAAIVFRALAAAKPVIHQSPKVIDSLREHGAKVSALEGLNGESGAAALEKNFLSAASLGDGFSATLGGDGTPAVTASQDTRELMSRLLERVRLDDRGRPDEKQALEDAFKRLIGTPTGRLYAEEFIAEGLTAVVHFEDFPDSQLFLVEGRKKFYAAQALTDWRQESGTVEVRLNRHYVDGDPEYLRESLPSIIGHELLGHGLWYGRAAKNNLYLAFHYHELNETLARLVGWAVDFELDQRFEDGGAWSYLQDPGGYLAKMKLTLPYYSVTFSAAEMADPVKILESRLVAASGAQLERAKTNLANQKTWLPVLEKFATGRYGVAPELFGTLRTELNDLVAYYESALINTQAIITELTRMIGAIKAEPNRDSERYLSESSSHLFFKHLAENTRGLGAGLLEAVQKNPPLPARPAPPRSSGHITWDELAKMHNDDLARR